MYVQPPVDYPQATDTPSNQKGDLTYAAILDLAEAEKPITDAMIREACNKMEAAQQYPFAPKSEITDATLSSQASSYGSAKLLTLLTKLRSVRNKR